MEPSHGQLIVAFLVGVLFCSFAVTAAVAGGAPPSNHGAVETGFGDLATEEFEADRTQFRIILFENGSAEWVFHYEQRLESDSAREEFEAYAERFNDEETENYRNFRTRAEALTASGSDVTDREMSAGSFDRNARIEERSPAGNEFAIVEMSFVWTGFAESDGHRLVVGDVFVDGLYVGPNQHLRFERGPALRFESIEPEADSISGGTLEESDTVSWIGEQQFTDRHPRIVYTSKESGSNDSGTNPSDTTTATPATGSLVPLVVLAVVIVLGAITAIAYRFGMFPDAIRTKDEADSADRRSTDGINTDVEATADPKSDAESVMGAPETGTGLAVSPSISDEELLSDEERVITLLEDRGGRMRQVDIVGNTEWSKSKVSMLLSEMEEDGVISKLRVGRENIVSLAGHEPDAAGSPFDDVD